MRVFDGRLGSRDLSGLQFRARCVVKDTYTYHECRINGDYIQDLQMRAIGDSSLFRKNEKNGQREEK